MMIYNFDNLGGVSDIYNISTNLGTYDGYDCVTIKTDNGFLAERDGFSIKCNIEESDGVNVRGDVVENTSDKTLQIYNYAYRFCVESGEVDVYTQLSSWQNESDGRWQNLVTGVSAMSKGIYTTSDATPMVAIWNKQINRGVVFHIMPRHGWKIDVSKRNAVSGKIHTVIEISICDDALCISLEKGECIELSPIVYYEFTDRTTLDCHKLHKYMNEKYPHKSMPVMYNSWLAFFDRISYDVLITQAEEAAKLGCEYFVIDAGWFGDGDKSWTELIGMWEENQTGAIMGRMKDVSDKVHSIGMKFGMWLETERALKGVKSVEEHPEFFFTNGTAYFLDYSNPDAREYMKNIVFSLVEKYNVDYIKFDFNDNMTYDESRKAFLDYHKGYYEFISSVRMKFPEIYLEGCGGGGFRLDLDKVRLFDSYWFTDNQSVVRGAKILKNTILRMPPTFLDRWISVISADGFTPAYGTGETKRIISTDNGTWDSVIGVNTELIKAFFAGGNIGLSCDLTKWDDSLKKEMADFIAEYKKERHFWRDATCRIICDTDSVVALQYENGEKIKVVIYTCKLNQTELRIYTSRGKEILIKNPHDYCGYIFEVN